MQVTAKIQIIRVGRRRKPGKRKPSGDISKPREDARIIAFAQPHRSIWPEDMRADQKAESPLGRLAMGGIISEEQLQASKDYARVVQRYHAVINAPSPNPAAIGLVWDRGGGSPVPIEDEDAKYRKAEYEAAFEAVYKVGHRPARALARTAVYGEYLPQGTTLDDLKRGLNAAVDHFSLTRRKQQSRSGDMKR